MRARRPTRLRSSSPADQVTLRAMTSPSPVLEAPAGHPLPRPVLTYPHEAPANGQTLTVAPGVRWLRMPLPYALNHINLWLLDDGEGQIALVDNGCDTPEAREIWARLLGANASGTSPRVSRVFATHMHPDHVGLAGWHTRAQDCRLWMTRGEYMHCRTLVADTGREAPPDAIRFYQQAGWNEASLDSYRERFGAFGRHIHPLPDSFRRLQDGEEIRIGGHSWQVVVGRGHCPEHACFWCPELKLFISGDQVLPRISSNVSVHPTEPDADPMSDWLASLDLVEQRVPDDVLVLPSHGSCFYGLHARIKQLRDGQLRSLTRLQDRLQEPKRALDVFVALFGRPIDPADTNLLGMATGESLACMNYFVARGEAVRELDAQGVAWYRLASIAMHPGPEPT
jgi:glyoxylase-like metal-dependent hydrolase (beta-lactamase superfamily II)